MIIAGDRIDASLGLKLGISTMAAAALGNLISDICGIGIGDMIEGVCMRWGLTSPSMTHAARNHMLTRCVKGASGVVGISIGCLLGMFPLLWLDNRKQLYFSDRDMCLYKRVFEPYGVTPHAYFEVLKQAAWKTAPPSEVMVRKGSMLRKIIVINQGEATSEGLDHGRHVMWRYVGHDFDFDAPAAGNGGVGKAARSAYGMRGSIIGGTALVDASLADKHYPNEVRAVSTTEYIEIELEGLKALMQEDKCVNAAVFGTLYHDVKKGKAWDKQNKYKEYQATQAPDPGPQAVIEER
jgi:tRNA-specific adenosine deaminase 1